MTLIEKKSVGLNPAGQFHLTDHLAPMSVIMGMPLIFLEEFDYNLGKKYYPELDAQLVDFLDFNPEYLITRYDVLFMSHLWKRQDFREKYAPLEAKYKKQLRVVHCPHGYSDKTFYLCECASEDITLVYGQQMLDVMKQEGTYQNLHGYVMSGNYRYTYYKQHRAFFDTLFQNEVLSHFAKKKPIILYAPTWQDSDNSTSYFLCVEKLLDELPDDYNMIVKLHPCLELNDTGEFYRIIGKYEKKGNVFFLKDFPLVFPVLAHADLFIGDMSAVGYDFLAFNKPMFFLNMNQRNSTSKPYLYRCGTEIQPQQLAQVYFIIAQELPRDQEKFGKIRQETFKYTFGEERSFSDIKRDIIKCYHETQVPL